MKIRFFLFLTIALNYSVVFSQKPDSTYTKVDFLEFNDNSGKRPQSNFYFGSAFHLAIREFRNIYDSEKLRRVSKEETKSKFEIINSTYSNAENIPEKINDGWHTAIATDKITYCKDVKILVSENRIKQFVIENYLPLNFTSTGEIKKAKATLTLSDFNGESLEIVEVYFIYDLDQPNITSEPIEPGYITFWSDWEKFESIKIFVDNVEQGVLG